MHELTLDADLEDLRRIGPWLRELLEADPAVDEPEDLAASMELALQELAVNSVVHGYDGGPGAIDLSASRLADGWQFVLTDAAPAFDPGAVDDPTEPQEHGYGVMIIRQLTREYETWRADDHNHTRLIFDAPPCAASITAEGAT